ncbi:aldehyde dehydrogenase family protein, partial [Escherichia coli]|nr:aldehyde dehydrogenase family protein [Escherichia coli]
KASRTVNAVPLIDGVKAAGKAQNVISPVNGATVGTVVFATADEAAKAVGIAKRAFVSWSRVPVETRAKALEKAGDLLENNRDLLMDLLSREAGKTLDDGIAEIREAVDFCRYYAAEARRQFATDKAMPGPTGEDNKLRH